MYLLVRRLALVLLLIGLSAPLLARPPATPPGNPALEPVLAGEFALQAGKLEQAAGFYLDAARQSGDAVLAERATRIALLANQDKIATDALALWKKRGEPSLALTAAETTLALRQGRSRQARQGAESLLRSPDPRGWRYALIALSSGGDNTQRTAAVLMQLRERGLLPKDDLGTMLAWAGLAQRLQDKALLDALITDAGAAYPDAPQLQLLRAALAREAGDLQGARRLLDDLRDNQPMLSPIGTTLAGEYELLGDPATAAEVLAEGPQDLRVMAMRAALLSKAEDDPGLEALYAELKVQADSPDPRVRLLLGQIAETLEHHDQALEWYESIDEPALAGLLRLRRATTLHAMARNNDAFAALRSLQHDEEIAEDLRRDAFLAEAELRGKDKDADGEFDAYARGLAQMPDNLAILYARALAWERIDKIDLAEADLRKILLIEPDNVAALNALGYTLADRTTRYREALELIDRARVADPGNAAIIDSHGWVLYRLGRHKEALVQLKRAFALFKDAEVAAHIAEVLWVMGRKDEARQYFDEARRIDPEHRALKRALEKTGAEI
ncbi:MAG: tetratricopeptide repeat protein [Pseudomonadota bacterium]|nr:tetratricopeptide repeat protein [Pseudomonadota bacterium]